MPVFDPNSVDIQFYNRADTHINVSNQQSRLFGAAPAAESSLYASARFAAWLISTGCTSRAELEAKSAAEMDRFTDMFRGMLEQNMRDHIGRFDDTMKRVR